MTRLPPKSVRLTVLLGAVSALPPLSIDMNLPALVLIADDFSAAPERAALTMSAFLAGFSISQLLYGPMSDRFGRRPVLVFGALFFTLSGLFATWAPSMEALILARLAQGAGAGAGVAIVRAMVRDIHDDPRAARVAFSHVGMILQLAPILAPIIGALTLHVFHGWWRSIFLIMALAGGVLAVAILLGLPETLREKNFDALSPRHFLGNYGRFFLDPRCAANAAIAGLSFGALFAFITGSSLAFVSTLGFSIFAYVGLFATISAFIVAGSFINARISMRLSRRQSLGIGVYGAFAGSCLALAAMLLPSTPSVWLLVLGLSINALSFGFVVPNTSQAALEPIPEIAGTGGAAFGFVQMAGGSLSSALVGRLYAAIGASAMPSTMLLFASGSLTIFLFIEAMRERRRGE